MGEKWELEYAMPLLSEEWEKHLRTSELEEEGAAKCSLYFWMTSSVT